MKKAVAILCIAFLCMVSMPIIANAKEYAVTFDMSRKCYEIGTDLVIKGTSTGGDTVDIAIDDKMVAVDIPIDENGIFIKKIPTGHGTLLGMPGSIVIRAYVNGPRDRDGNPVNVNLWDEIPEGLGIFEDGSTAVRIMSGTSIIAEISRDSVTPGGKIFVYGVAYSDRIDILLIPPRGCSITHYTASMYDRDFSEKIHINRDADIGSHAIILLSPGRDGVYGTGIDISDWINTNKEKFSSKGREQITNMIRGTTVDVAGSDDVMSTKYIKVEPPKITLGKNEYEIASGEPLYIVGHTNLEYGDTVLVILQEGGLFISNVTSAEEDGTFTVKLDTEDIILGGYTITASSAEASDFATVTVLKHGKRGLITQINSTRLTITKGNSGVLSFTVNNPIGNPTVTEQIVIKVPSGIEITGATFVAGGAGMYVSEPRKLSSGGIDSVELSVSALEFRGKGWEAIVEGYVTYSYEYDPNQYETKAHTLTYKIPSIPTSVPTRTPIPTPTPITPMPTPNPTETPGFGAIFAIAGLLLVRYFLRERK